MIIWPNGRVVLACGAILMAMASSTHAADALSPGTQVSFDLATYREMERFEVRLRLPSVTMRRIAVSIASNRKSSPLPMRCWKS